MKTPPRECERDREKSENKIVITGTKANVENEQLRIPENWRKTTIHYGLFWTFPRQIFFLLALLWIHLNRPKIIDGQFFFHFASFEDTIRIIWIQFRGYGNGMMQRNKSQNLTKTISPVFFSTLPRMRSYVNQQTKRSPKILFPAVCYISLHDIVPMPTKKIQCEKRLSRMSFFLLSPEKE